MFDAFDKLGLGYFFEPVILLYCPSLPDEQAHARFVTPERRRSRWKLVKLKNIDMLLMMDIVFNQ